LLADVEVPSRRHDAASRERVMSVSAVRVLVAAACLLWLSGCSTSTKLPGLFSSAGNDPSSTAAIAEPDADPDADPTSTGSTGSAYGPLASTHPPVTEPNGGSSGTMGKDPNDDVSLGKKHYHAGHFGNAEKHFRRAVEQYPKDAEAWVGLAASYDRLKRFDLADRAYAQASKLIGDTPELLNNKGYSLLLRGDYTRAKTVLLRALALAPDNPYIRNNLELLEKSRRNAKAVR
jgi:tetratricopeptide (TPR) repeat protein